ncbi:MAG: beta-galactosidase [Clostridia bacterium]|nr:beta-galactosidase [Clostridia bacterium]
MEPLGYIVHGGDYNPDQWIDTPEIWDEDMRLMKEAGINSATVGIFAWSLIEPEEGVYDFSFLDTILDKMHKNGIKAILATPSGARPPWLSQKYPEVLRVEETGIRNEFGVRHNHCLTSPVYREKVQNINRLLAERYKDHPALMMWHISNEYSGECHCEKCQKAFREWLKKEYHNDLNELNFKWWNGFWSHRVTDWEQISSPKFRGENHVSALKLCWNRFVSDSHISFFENEIKPLREITPDIPITTNMMGTYNGIDYQKLAKKLDIVSYDSYPPFDAEDPLEVAKSWTFIYDIYRSMGGNKPFFLMESSPSLVNWRDVNKLLMPGRHAQSSMLAVSHGADSVQYFQWRKSRGGHEKFHGAVVDHIGTNETRVFREVAKLGEQLKKLGEVTGGKCESRVAVICDWENSWATTHFHGYNNLRRDYFDECQKWHLPFSLRGIPCDVISETDDYSSYDLIIAPFMYMLKTNVEEKIRSFVKNGGSFVATYLFAVADKDDMVYYGGLPANGLKEVFGIWAEESDGIPEGREGTAEYNSKEYKTQHICDVIHSKGAEVLGTYTSDFYAGEPSVTRNSYGKGKAYYAAFRNDEDFADDFCSDLIKELCIKPSTDIIFPRDIIIRKRGELIFILNFTDEEKAVTLDKTYYDILSETDVTGILPIPENGYCILKQKEILK